MILYPAIYLRGGRCVWPRHDTAAGLAEDEPAALARRWRDGGATWLHVVDLDGAREGHLAQSAAVRDIAGAVKIPIQLGGGLSSEEDVVAAFAAGVARVVLGTPAASDPRLLDACLTRWDERIAVSVDARGERVTVAGWLESTSETATDFARRMVGVGVRTLLMADIERDGTLAGSGSTRLLDLRAALPQVALIAAGDIASLDDIRRLARAELDGAVLGRALYEGALDLADALRVARAAGASAAPGATERGDRGDRADA